MELRQLRQFVAVAEAGSFSLAAERLCMAQPPLSVAIRKLEDEMGISLFERTGRGVRLTPEGETALAGANRCLKEASDLTNMAQSAQHDASGLLNIACIGSAVYGLLPKILKVFASRYPGIKFTLREYTNHETLIAVENGSIDLGFVRVPIARPVNVEFQQVEQDRFCAALPNDHPLCQQTTLSLQDMADETFIGYVPSRAGGLQGALMLTLLQAGISARITQEAVQVQTAIGLVEGGLGVALVPSVHAATASPRVTFRPIRDLPPEPVIGIALAYAPATESASTRRFRAVVQELYPVEPLQMASIRPKIRHGPVQRIIRP
jgi:DNA-binding transcriptional LysR family regulator